MRHKNADMIKAKVDNVDLIVFSKAKNLGDWREVSLIALIVNDNFDFFLCLPQHKEACLHWLNGGDVLYSEFQSSWEQYTLTPDFPKYPLQDFCWAQCTFKIE